MIGDRARMLAFNETALRLKYPGERIAADDDFKAYRKDPALVKLTRG